MEEITEEDIRKDQKISLRPQVLEWFSAHTVWMERSEEAFLGLDRVYIVCMESRVEHVRRFIKKNGLEGRVSILRAFTPDRVNLDELIEFGILSSQFSKRGGRTKYERAICCSLSHFACWLEGEATEAGRILIFEDDLELVDERQRATLLVKSASPFDWDLLYFSYCHLVRSQATPLGKDLFQFPGALCACAYAVSADGRRSLLSTAFPFKQAIDDYLYKKSTEANFLTLGARSTLFSQDRTSVDSSFGDLRPIGPPTWFPSPPQKLLSRLYSLLTRTGGAGYDRAILDLDSFRRGELKDLDLKRPLIRSWAFWTRQKDQKRSLRPQVLEWFSAHTVWMERSEEAFLGLDRIYIVCMESRVEHVRRFIKKNGLEGRVSILRAFTPDRVNLDELIKIGILSSQFSKRGGRTKYERAICCSLSHFACWLEGEATEAGRILIFEDDLELVDERQRATLLVKSASPFDWDLLYFSYCHLVQSQATPLGKDLFQFPGVLCTGAYAVSADGRRSLLSTAFPFKQAIDDYLYKKSTEANFLTLGARSTLFPQDRTSVDSSFGDLRPIGPPTWFPSLPQKLLSRLYSLLTRTGGAGYDRAILDLDSFRRGELKDLDLKRPLIRSWAFWTRIGRSRNHSQKLKS